MNAPLNLHGRDNPPILIIDFAMKSWGTQEILIDVIRDGVWQELENTVANGTTL
jgi:hypothetical protein